MPDAYKNARPAPIDLASGRVLAPGEPVLVGDLDLGHTGETAKHDQRYVDDGVLVEAILDAELSGDELAARAADLNIKGRSKMNADELRAAVATAAAEGADPATTEEGSS